MKFKCGPTESERDEIKKHKSDWHEYFAWHPVRLESEQCAWLETIERKGKYYHASYAGDAGWIYEYREANEQRNERQS